ncbi:helix-turn-helix domain-containing protein [Streptomyces sp. NPDC059104]|uniref:helix-turn-helix domain-containing protein n=1 Tax=Streptomyces sp. NPDC059104 TaxID=3346729 RepID=UPI0036B36381
MRDRPADTTWRQPNGHPELHAAVQLLAGEVGNPRLGTGSTVPALPDALPMYALLIWFAEQPTPVGTTGWAAALDDPAVTATLDAVHRNPAAPRAMAELAVEAGLSWAAVTRRCSSPAGQPPAGYLGLVMNGNFSRLLRATATPLKSVAAHAGYASESAVASAFKRAHGLAPGAHRRSG